MIAAILAGMTDSAKPSMIEDAARDSVIMRLAPEAARPWLEVMRADRPIGTWLLLLPCWQGLALASAGRAVEGIPWWSFYNLWLIAAFGVGAIVMRGAGCALNDIVDRDFDRAVQRTRNRPIATGRISRTGAAAFGAGLCLVGGAVLLTFNSQAIILGVLSIIPAAFYPFAKRLTSWPQIALGIAFNWGALVGWVAIEGSLSPAPLLLYAGGICWTVGYDTVYALMDKDDDQLVGVKSTARLFGERARAAIGAFYAGAAVLAGVAGYVAGMGPLFWIGLVAYALHLAWQVRTLQIHDRATCLRLFRANRDSGLLLLLAIVAGGFVS